MGDGTFKDISQRAAFTDPGMGWGVGFLDYDNDTYQDIYIANDFLFSPDLNILYRNSGSLPLTNVSAGTPLGSPYGAYGMACADVNNDGRVDIAIANTYSAGNQLFLNQQPENNWIKIKCIGTKNNRSGIGTRLTVWAAGIRQIDEIIAGSGFAAQNSLTQHFGLGNAEKVDSLIVSWPGGFEEKYFDLESKRQYTVTESQGIDFMEKSPSSTVDAIVIAPSPNPFQEKTSCSIQLFKEGRVEIKIFDLQGSEVVELQKGILEQGLHEWTWYGKNRKEEPVSPGIYFMRIKTPSKVSLMKISKSP